MSDFAVETNYISNLEGCCLGGMPLGWVIVECPYFIESENDGPEGVVVAKIKYGSNSRWAVVIDSQDYTGHG